MELVFATLCIIFSLFCQRITLVFARAGFIRQDFFTLIVGTIANYAWVSSVIWFYFDGEWLIPLIAFLVSLFGINTLVIADKTSLYQNQNIFNIITILLILGSWYGHNF